MNQIGSIIEENKQQLTVRSTVNSYKDINNTVNSIPVKEEYKELETKTDDFLIELSNKPDYMADRLARELDDLKSKLYYLLLAKNTDPHILLEALSCTIHASREGKIRSEKAFYFMGILRNKGVQTVFNK